jgi:hypothetical protein
MADADRLEIYIPIIDRVTIYKSKKSHHSVALFFVPRVQIIGIGEPVHR